MSRAVVAGGLKPCVGVSTSIQMCPGTLENASSRPMTRCWSALQTFSHIPGCCRDRGGVARAGSQHPPQGQSGLSISPCPCKDSLRSLAWVAPTPNPASTQVWTLNWPQLGLSKLAMYCQCSAGILQLLVTSSSWPLLCSLASRSGLYSFFTFCSLFGSSAAGEGPHSWRQWELNSCPIFCHHSPRSIACPCKVELQQQGQTHTP